VNGENGQKGFFRSRFSILGQATSTDRLEKFPESGRKPPELKESRYLEIIVNPCRIFYRIADDKVYILYVMRSERKLRKYLLNARENS
jgi:toxin ParE1/3/4